MHNKSKGGARKNDAEIIYMEHFSHFSAKEFIKMSPKGPTAPAALQLLAIDGNFNKARGISKEDKGPGSWKSSSVLGSSDCNWGIYSSGWWYSKTYFPERPKCTCSSCHSCSKSSPFAPPSKSSSAASRISASKSKCVPRASLSGLVGLGPERRNPDFGFRLRIWFYLGFTFGFKVLDDWKKRGGVPPFFLYFNLHSARRTYCFFLFDLPPFFWPREPHSHPPNFQQLDELMAFYGQVLWRLSWRLALELAPGPPSMGVPFVFS